MSHRITLRYSELLAARKHCINKIDEIEQQLSTQRWWHRKLDPNTKQHLESQLQLCFEYLSKVDNTFLRQIETLEFQIDVDYPIL